MIDGTRAVVMTEQGDSVSGIRVWVVGTLSGPEAETLSERFRRLVADEEANRPPEHTDSLAWWERGCDGEPFFRAGEGGSGSLVPTEAGLRFAELVQAESQGIAAAQELWDEVMDPVSGNGPAERFSTVGHRASPVAALFYGLGAEAASLLPGRFGHFLLPAHEVPTALAKAERALALTGPGRAEVLRRIDAWMTGTENDAQFAATDLLEAPLRVLRSAAANRRGATAFTGLWEY